ncbi:hypothetical protein R9C00_19895 [Flammeovirgaceae bacterium SG7u.111]|nr:hypothetical protein [Flammeovirgaceae bacterium SG7u.132]WPO33963.1 hypothetical protein R9C00_19895 [Flammeovirgaceae bacterium SG7u.111]
MKNNSFLFIILALSICSCGHDKVNYFNFAYPPKNKPIFAQGEFTNKGVENGEFTISSDSLLINGKYKQGQKLGTWFYKIDSSEFKINWKSCNVHDINMSFSVPEDWDIYDRDGVVVLAALPQQDKKNPREFLKIIKYPKEELDLTSSVGQCFLQTQNDYNLISSKPLRIVDIENVMSYYLRLELDNNTHFLFYFFEYGDDIYQVSFLTLKQNLNINFFLFFDIIHGMMLNNKKIFSPYKSYQASEFNLVPAENG